MSKNATIGLLVTILIIILLGFAFWWGSTKSTTIEVEPVPTTDTSVAPTPTPAREVGIPVVTTSESVTSSNSTALVTGQVTPNGVPTTYWYEYGETTALGTNTSSQSIGSGFTRISTPGYITGLKANTSYYFRLSAKNSFGTVNGTTLTFKTNDSQPPKVSVPTSRTDQATNVARTTASLNGQINPNGYQTNYWFEYGTQTSLGSITGFQTTNAGVNPVPVTLPITGLTPLTKYYFRLNAQNLFGTVNGSLQSFTTPGPADPSAPTVNTTSSTNVATSSVTLNGRINPNDGETSYWFEYSKDKNLSTIVGTVTAPQPLSRGTSVVAVKLNVNNLDRNTTYYYRLGAKNQFGSEVRGDIMSFKTK